MLLPLIRASASVVRGVFPAGFARDWFAEVGDYLKTNHYEQREVEKRSLDKLLLRAESREAAGA